MIRVGLLPRQDFEENRIEQGLCVVCSKPLTGRRTVYCSDRCHDEYWTNHSWTWLREDMIHKSNFTCAKCGFHLEISKDIEHSYRCVAPKTDNRLGKCYNFPLSVFVVDHIVPIALDGDEFDRDNLQVLCKRCNKIKTAKDRKAIARAKRYDTTNTLSLDGFLERLGECGATKQQ